MENKKLHIISFDVPWPDNYGGVIDVFHKIRHLKNAGWDLWLHCFTHKRKKSKELEALCERVFYYPRRTGKVNLLSTTPYIVLSRTHPELLKNLKKNTWPVLFEGLHCTALLSDPELRNRNTIVRAHNIEHEYYENLYHLEKNPFKKLYYQSESRKLRSYEKTLSQASCIAAISTSDTHYFSSKYGHTFYLPAFHAYDEVDCREGRGEYCLYHGNLSVAENHKAALWLIEKVTPFTSHPLILAGQHPRKELQEKVKAHPRVQLIENPEEKEMQTLIQHAQVHTLPALQGSGIKLKLLHALYRGRHVVTNSKMIIGTGLEELCEIADTPEAFAENINKVFPIAFCHKKIEKRVELLEKKFSNSAGAALLGQLIRMHPVR